MKLKKNSKKLRDLKVNDLVSTYKLQSIKIRIYPNKKHENLFNRLFGCYRFTYNQCLDYKKNAYDKDKTIISRNNLQKYFHSILIKDNIFLQEFNSNILKYSIDVLNKSYKSFFNQQKNHPTFKSKNDKQSIKFIKHTCISRNNLDDGKINLTKNLKGIKYKTSEEYNKYLLENKDKIKSITISKNKSEVYHASILFNTEMKILNENIK